MGAANALRADFEASDLRRLAKSTKDATQSRRLLALAEIYDGGARSDAVAGLLDRKAPVSPAKLDDGQRQALAAIVESGPIPSIHGVARWRLKDLARWIWEEFRVSLDETTVGRVEHRIKTLADQLADRVGQQAPRQQCRSA